MVPILQKELKWPSLCITGDTPVGERKKIIDQFNTDEIHRILIGTEALSYGLNIQRATYIVHFDAPWSVSKIEQREGRAHRIGQDKPVTVYHLIARNTIDEYVLKVLKGKQKMADEILGDGEVEKLTMVDIEEMLGEKNVS